MEWFKQNIIEYSQNILLHRKLFAFGKSAFRKMAESVCGLLRSYLSTAAASKVNAELNPTLSFCVAMENGTQISFSRLSLRGILGKTAYAVDSDFTTQSASQANRRQAGSQKRFEGFKPAAVVHLDKLISVRSGAQVETCTRCRRFYSGEIYRAFEVLA
ncbi:hypothetical protein KRR38_34870 [Novosphingobium sp. G106]|uniref:hypothetical protein n=1 Tax=Novosphingobium sp. G106 TaxID=2849500 RepID=UPI001C2DDCB6|nr:hypothetical protein [Novosphingobium sp. G106]MBV1692677.1 hypothetical protein [Novosphingobium sp. G106]